jgi:hypothetical protein
MGFNATKAYDYQSNTKEQYCQGNYFFQFNPSYCNSKYIMADCVIVVATILFLPNSITAI